ncbi:hypothetical protein L6Q96_09580 [Candidatus Binatia bacterium]|nr:hypothetical protein [Candidatus Binatia bacterium]
MSMKLNRRLLAGVMGALLCAPAAALAEPPSRAEMEEELSAVFAQADTDGSGTLNTGEFATFDTIMRQNMTRRHFTRVDDDGDGTVTLEELQAAGPGGCRGPGGPPPL